MNVRNREAFGSAFQTDLLVEDDCHFTRCIGTYHARWNFKNTNSKEGLVFRQGSWALWLKGMQQWILIFPWNTFSVHCRGEILQITTCCLWQALPHLHWWPVPGSTPLSHCSPEHKTKHLSPEIKSNILSVLLQEWQKFKHSVLQHPIIHGQWMNPFIMS